MSFQDLLPKMFEFWRQRTLKVNKSEHEEILNKVYFDEKENRFWIDEFEQVPSEESRYLEQNNMLFIKKGLNIKRGANQMRIFDKQEEKEYQNKPVQQEVKIQKQEQTLKRKGEQLKPVDKNIFQINDERKKKIQQEQKDLKLKEVRQIKDTKIEKKQIKFDVKQQQIIQKQIDQNYVPIFDEPYSQQVGIKKRIQEGVQTKENELYQEDFFNQFLNEPVRNVQRKKLKILRQDNDEKKQSEIQPVIRQSTRIQERKNEYQILFYEDVKQLDQKQINEYILLKKSHYNNLIKDEKQYNFSQINFLQINQFLNKNLHEKFQKNMQDFDAELKVFEIELSKINEFKTAQLYQSLEKTFSKLIAIQFNKFYTMITYQEGTDMHFSGKLLKYTGKQFMFFQTQQEANFLTQEIDIYEEQDVLQSMKNFSQQVLRIYNQDRNSFNFFCQDFFNSKTIINVNAMFENEQLDNQEYQIQIKNFFEQIIVFCDDSNEYFQKFESVESTIFTMFGQLLKLFKQQLQQKCVFQFREDEIFEANNENLFKQEDYIPIHKIVLFQYFIQILKDVDLIYVQKWIRMTFFQEYIAMDSRIKLQFLQQGLGVQKQKLAIFRYQNINFFLQKLNEFEGIESYTKPQYLNQQKYGEYFNKYNSKMFSIGRDFIKSKIYYNYQFMPLEGRERNERFYHEGQKLRFIDKVDRFYQQKNTFDFDQQGIIRLVNLIKSSLSVMDLQFLQQQRKISRKLIYNFRFDIVNADTQETLLENNYRQGVNLKIQLDLALCQKIIDDQQFLSNDSDLEIIQKLRESVQEMQTSTLNKEKDKYLNSEQFDVQLVLQTRRSNINQRQNIQLILHTYMIIQVTGFLKIQARDRQAPFEQAEQIENFYHDIQQSNIPPIVYIFPSLSANPFYGKYNQYVQEYYREFEKSNKDINCLQRILKYLKSENYQKVQTLTEYERELKLVQQNLTKDQVIIYFNCHVFITENPKKMYHQKQSQNQVKKYKLNKELKFFKKTQNIIYFDIETTTGIQNEMQPVILCYKWVQINKTQYIEKINEVLCVQNIQDNITDQFVQKILEISDEIGQQNLLYIQSWNGAKFDNILLLKSIVKFCQSYLMIHGNINNLKSLKFRNIVLQDCMMNCGGGSLDSFCASMQQKGKIKDQVIEQIMFQIKSKNDFINLNQELKNKYIEYCFQDVNCMEKSIKVFNENLKQVIKDVIELKQNEEKENYQNSIKSLENQQLLTINTLPSLSYQIMIQIINQQQELIHLPDFDEIHHVMSQAYRGGMTQVFSSKKFEVGVRNIQQIQYIDVNSEYPFIMQERKFYLRFQGCSEIFKENETIYDSCLYIIENFKLDQVFTLGYFPVKIQSDVLYPQSFDSFETFNYINKTNISKNEYDKLKFQKQFKLAVFGKELKQYFLLKQLLKKQITLEQFENQNEKDCGIFQTKDIKITSYYPSFDESRNIFSYMNYFYEQRMKLKNHNKTLAQIYKIIMNSSYGQLGMREYSYDFYYPEETIEKIKLQEELNENGKINETQKMLSQALFENDIQDVYLEDFEKIEDVNLFHFKYRNQLQYPQLEKTKLKHLAAQITSYSRSYLLESMYKLMYKQYYPIYCDTDSIIYVSTKIDMQDVLQIDEKLGSFKYEYTDIKSVQCIVPKVYNLQIKEDGKQDSKNIYKSKGIQLMQTLNQFDVKKEYNEKNVSEFFQQMSEQILKQKQERNQISFINQLNFKRNYGEIRQQITTKTLDLREKRMKKLNDFIYNLQPFNNIQQFFVQ